MSENELCKIVEDYASAMCKQVDEAEALSTLLEKVLREARSG